MTMLLKICSETLQFVDFSTAARKACFEIIRKKYLQLWKSFPIINTDEWSDFFLSSSSPKTLQPGLCIEHFQKEVCRMVFQGCAVPLVVRWFEEPDPNIWSEDFAGRSDAPRAQQAQSLWYTGLPAFRSAVDTYASGLLFMDFVQIWAKMWFNFK